MLLCSFQVKNAFVNLVLHFANWIWVDICFSFKLWANWIEVCPLAEWLTANSFDLFCYTIIRLFVANESMVSLTFDKQATVSEIFMESRDGLKASIFWLPLSKNLDPAWTEKVYSKGQLLKLARSTKNALAHHKWYDNDSSCKA